MEFLGIGPLELLFIILIALIVLGPNDMVKAGKTLGRWMRKMVTSEGWQIFQQTSRDLRYLPNKLMREAGIDEINETLRDTAKDLDANTIGTLDGYLKESANLQKSRMDESATAPVIDSPPPPAIETTPASADESTAADAPISGDSNPPEQSN